jgi:hypothetical protein
MVRDNDGVDENVDRSVTVFLKENDVDFDGLSDMAKVRVTDDEMVVELLLVSKRDSVCVFDSEDDIVLSLDPVLLLDFVGVRMLKVSVTDFSGESEKVRLEVVEDESVTEQVTVREFEEDFDDVTSVVVLCVALSRDIDLLSV